MMNRRNLAIALTTAIVASAAFPANAAVRLTSTYLGNDFAAPDSSLNSQGWSRWQLDFRTDDGAVINAVDVLVQGPLHQRWGPDNDFDGNPDPTPQGLVANQRGDSHLTPVAGALIGSAPTEDNNTHPSVTSPLPDGQFDYGVGTFLAGAWGIPHASQTTTADVAYVVVPDACFSVTIDYEVATSAGTFTGTAHALCIPEPTALCCMLCAIAGVTGWRRR